MALRSLTLVRGGRRRTEADKDFYRSAEGVQRSSKLANGCLSADYSKKALAFLIHIKPNLPQSYDDDDTTQYLVNLMPEALKEGGRRIKNELRAEGKYHDFMHVIRHTDAMEGRVTESM